MDCSETGTATKRPKRMLIVCEHCHARKIRCDVAISSPPCMNCRLDKIACVVRKAQKRGPKFKSDRDPRPRRQRQTRNEQTSMHDHLPTEDFEEVRPSVNVFSSQPNAPIVEHDDAVPFYCHTFLDVAEIQQLDPTTVKYLEAEGCLHLPAQPVLDVFIDMYFLHVHPQFPVLDEASFRSSYSNRSQLSGTLSKVSLCLLRGMLVSASRFVTLDTIQACGFTNPRQLRVSFHYLAATLHSCLRQENKLERAMCCLLLSLRSTIQNHKLNSLWLSKAIEIAKQAGAHLNNTVDSDDLARSWKRLWYSCILRDRMIALGVRRPLQIPLELESTDFEGVFSLNFPTYNEEYSTFDRQTTEHNQQLFISQCQLSISMTPAIMCTSGKMDQEQATAKVSRLLDEMIAIERSKNELSVWARTWMASLEANHRSGHDTRSNDTLTLLRSMTLILFYSAKVSLLNHTTYILEQHRQQLDDLDKRLSEVGNDLVAAITSIADIIENLSNLGLVHYLPITAPSCTALPLVLQSLDFRLLSSVRNVQAGRRLKQFNEIMQMFSQHHDHAEYVSSIIAQAVHNINFEPYLRDFTAKTPLLSSREAVSDSPRRQPEWLGVFAQNPRLYLHISMSLDLALSHGRYPGIDSLPEWIARPATLWAPSSLSLSGIENYSPLRVANRLLSLNHVEDVDESATSTEESTADEELTIMGQEQFSLGPTAVDALPSLYSNTRPMSELPFASRDIQRWAGHFWTDTELWLATDLRFSIPEHETVFPGDANLDQNT